MKNRWIGVNIPDAEKYPASRIERCSTHFVSDAESISKQEHPCPFCAFFVAHNGLAQWEEDKARAKATRDLITAKLQDFVTEIDGTKIQLFGWSDEKTILIELNGNFYNVTNCDKPLR